MVEDSRESREAQAAREVGHTEVSPALARSLAGVFLLALLGVTGAEVARDAVRGSDSPWSGLASAPVGAWSVARTVGPLAGNRHLLSAMTAFEDALEERSALAERALPGVQWVLYRLLGGGNEQVVAGRGGWLYFRPGVDYLTSPGFLEPQSLARKERGDEWESRPRRNPLHAIADFAAQLAERGIGLVVVPTPVKAALHPEGLAPALAGVVPIENPSFNEFLARLADLEIPAYDPAPRLAESRRGGVQAQFLRTDTHWTPQAMEDVAEGLAEFLARHVPLPERSPVAYRRHQVGVVGRGDLAALLRSPTSRPLFRPEPALTRLVVGSAGEPWTPDPAADILVLGDSFTNIYSQPELGWGEAAGFAEQLSYFLSRPVDKLAVNAGGPAAARERLASGLAVGDDRLAGKRLVVYQFSARELASGDWRLVDLAPARRSGAPAATPPRARRAVEGLLAKGFIVWESNRSGDWRMWTRRLEGSAPRQLSPEEPGRQHCCAHISPDGLQLVYLSRVVSRDRYPELEVPGELRLLRLDGTGERVLVADARPYGWGNRAAVWRSARELSYSDADGRTHLLDVVSGGSSPLTNERRTELAWLLDATLRYAVDGSPTFSSYDAGERRVVEGLRRPGCEPYFSHDGRFGFWVQGAGGPILWIELQSGATGTLLDQNDGRIPGAQRYAYFPMLSRDGRMLAFGASPGDHDHFRSNYDLFVAPVDPASLELLGRPLRLTSHPASDRYPDVHVEALDLARWTEVAPPFSVAGTAPPPPPPATGDPFEARAALRACSRVPSLREISPYRAALVVCEWELAEVLSGKAPGTRVRVAHWGLRNGDRQPIASAAAGLVARLRLEPLVGVVQIEGYPVFNTLPAAPDLALHYARQP